MYESAHCDPLTLSPCLNLSAHKVTQLPPLALSGSLTLASEQDRDEVTA